MKNTGFNNIRISIVLISMVLIIPIPACSESVGPAVTADQVGTIRSPAVAGGFYPDNPSRLKGMIRGFLAEAKVEIPGGKVVALIVPHAGYVYSGGTAAHSFQLLDGSGVKTVFLIGCSHKAYFPGVSVFGDDGYRTPLGVVPVDKNRAGQIREKDDNFTYYPRVHSQEHSLEVELPFLQEVLGKFKVVPILIGQADRGVIDKLGKVLGEVAGNTPDSVIVCSTDMTHYPPEKDARRIDGETLAAIRSMDREKVVAVREKYIPGPIPNLVCALCGEKAVLATMEAAEIQGVDRVEILDYSNSGDVSFGDKNRVVGYGAVAFLKPRAVADDKNVKFEKEKTMTEDAKDREGMSESARKHLMEIARQALTDAVNGRPLPDAPVVDPELQGHQGAFVTLNERGQLRGCIGQFTANRPLYQVVRGMALAAALRDTRFRPVQPAELDDIEIEISVLSPMRRITDPMKEVELGKHGIYIKRGYRTGTYLPQVATEHHMTKEEFLSSCTAHKAGLPPDAWKDPETEVYVYTAEVFGE
ncbi:MAG: AmmeMemoRadiSam system protein B [Candidatus Auribacterota bacterium]|nr:AmmeMemoRadiSam system protein B [Candidatus Auribacterota bacterium]